MSGDRLKRAVDVGDFVIGVRQEKHVRSRVERGHQAMHMRFHAPAAGCVAQRPHARSPVRRVNFRVEGARVGQVTDYDRLVLEIWTNGTLTPDMALVASHATDVIRALETEISPRLAAHRDTIHMHRGLYERIRQVEGADPEEAARRTASSCSTRASSSKVASSSAWRRARESSGLS